MSLKIAFIAADVHHKKGPASVTASLIERLCEDHQISVFAHTIGGIDVNKIKYYKVPAIRRRSLLGHLTFLASSTILLAFLSLLKKRDFDIIHSVDYLFYADVITSHFCEREGIRLERANIIEIPHGSAWQKLKAIDHKIYRSLQVFLEGREFGRNISKMRIVVSQRMKDEFVRYYGNASESIIVIPNGVDPEKFTPANRSLYRDKVRQRHGIARNDVVLMFAGGDWERKGVPQIIEALPLFVRPEVKLFIVGRGDEKFYGELAEQKQVREIITFVSGNANILEYYSASDVLVFPTMYEPFGLVIIEAMASGLPVITSRLAGASDFMNDGVDSLLLNDPSDINDLAAKIGLLLSNAELRKTMGEQARKTAENLSWEQVAGATLEVYHNVLKRKRGEQSEM